MDFTRESGCGSRGGNRVCGGGASEAGEKVRAANLELDELLVPVVVHGDPGYQPENKTPLVCLEYTKVDLSSSRRD